MVKRLSRLFSRSRQPTWPHSIHRRKCTHESPLLRHLAAAPVCGAYLNLIEMRRRHPAPHVPRSALPERRNPFRRRALPHRYFAEIRAGYRGATRLAHVIVHHDEFAQLLFHPAACGRTVSSSNPRAPARNTHSMPARRNRHRAKARADHASKPALLSRPGGGAGRPQNRGGKIEAAPENELG